MCIFMKKTLVQIYEVQEPDEAEALIALGVDHIGSVLLSQNSWKAEFSRKKLAAPIEWPAWSGF